MELPSKTQIDQLGDRLRSDRPNRDDLIRLDIYRQSYCPAYETVIRTIKGQLELQPSGRPAKSTKSLIEKLKRESIRLTQVQDIAGCRLTVADIYSQDHVTASIARLFPGSAVVDRRDKPKFGYRAVHVIPRVSGKPVEIQVRTLLQHMWAEISEKYADLFGTDIKYGGGDLRVRTRLDQVSQLVSLIEDFEGKLGETEGSRRWQHMGPVRDERRLIVDALYQMLQAKEFEE